MRKIYEIMIVTAAIRHRFSTSQKIRFFSESAPFQLRDKSAFPLKQRLFNSVKNAPFPPKQRLFNSVKNPPFPPSNIFPILQRTLKTKEESEEQSYKL